MGMGMGTGVCTAPVDSAADRPDVSAGVRTALPQKHHPYPSCPSAIVAFSPGSGHLQTAPSHPVQDLASWPVPGS